MRIALVFCALALAATSNAQDYNVQLLRVPVSSGIPNSFSTNVTGVSASGLIAGTVLTGLCGNCPYPPPYYRGFTYLSGSYQIVAVDNKNLSTWITGLNDTDQIVGYFQENNDDTGSFILQNGQLTKFGANPPTGQFNQVTGINNVGEMVGASHGKSVIQGFAISGGATTNISVKGQQFTVVQHVNDEGIVVGYYGGIGVNYKGFIWQDGKFSPLNYPNSFATELVGINDNGVIVGTYGATSGAGGSFLVNSSVFHAFTLPGTCNVIVSGINNQGVVYGSAYFGTKCDVEYGFVATPK